MVLAVVLLMIPCLALMVMLALLMLASTELAYLYKRFALMILSWIAVFLPATVFLVTVNGNTYDRASSVLLQIQTILVQSLFALTTTVTVLLIAILQSKVATLVLALPVLVMMMNAKEVMITPLPSLVVL
jgi:hypothetical protein